MTDSWLLFVLMAVIAAGGGVYFLLVVLRRRRLRRLAEALGLSFSAGRAAAVEGQLSHIEMFRRCDVHNVLEGRIGNWAVLACDARARDFKVGHGDTIRFSACLHPLEVPLPDLRIEPGRVMTQRVEDALQDVDVQLESDEFSRRIRVLARNRKFASDVCHALMMTWLFTLKHWRIEIVGGYVIVTDGRRWSAKRMRLAVEVLTSFLDRIPDFVWREYREKQVTS
jgi:hypothetical protein